MLSIITITFNNYEDLIQTCESLKPLKLSFEHIVINGGSCEKTLNFLESEFKGLHISEPDRGISDAFNKGVKIANGEYLTFLNSGDCLIDYDYYAIAIKKLELDKILKGVSTPMRITNQKGDYIRPALTPLPACPFNHPGFIFRATDIKQIPFLEKYKVAMDFDVFVRLTNLNFSNVAICQNVATEMQGGGISQVRTDLGAREKIEFLKENGHLDLKLRLTLYWQLTKAIIKRIVLK